MSEKFYAKGPGNEGYIKNMEVVGFHDADNHYLFQTQLYKTKDGRYYLYGGCFYGYGVEIIEVTDPAHPRHVQYMPVMDPEEYPYMSTPKVQICEDLMIVANGNCIPIIHGPAPEHYKPAPGGVHIYSLKDDPEHPEKLSFWATGDDDNPGAGVHRFTYNGGKYLHLSATAPGFIGYIYRIIDISDPRHPVEAGRWWNPGQFLGNQTKATQEKNIHGWNGFDTYPGYVHFPFADTDRNLTYISCVGAGFKILDISNPQVPQVLGEVQMTPPFVTKFGGALCHTFMPILGTNYAVGMQEGERFWCYSKEIHDKFGTQAMCGIEMFDVSDPTDPVMIAVFPYPEVPENFPYKNFNYCGMDYPGPLGPHNLHEPMSHKPWLENRKDRVYDSYFHAGLRVYDVSDPFVPKEIAYFIPPNPEKPLWELEMANKPLGTAEDVVVDDRGYIYLNTMHDGVYILKSLV